MQARTLCRYLTIRRAGMLSRLRRGKNGRHEETRTPDLYRVKVVKPYRNKGLQRNEEGRKGIYGARSIFERAFVCALIS